MDGRRLPDGTTPVTRANAEGSEWGNHRHRLPGAARSVVGRQTPDRPRPERPALGSIKGLRASHGWSGKRVFQLINEGEIEIVKLGGRTFVLLAGVDAHRRRWAKAVSSPFK